MPTRTPSRTPAPEKRGVWPSLGRSVCVEGGPSVPGPLPVVLSPLPLPGVSGDHGPAVMSPFRQPRLVALPSGQDNAAVFLSSRKASFQSKIKCPHPHGLRFLLKCLSPLQFLVWGFVPVPAGVVRCGLGTACRSTCCPCTKRQVRSQPVLSGSVCVHL